MALSSTLANLINVWCNRSHLDAHNRIQSDAFVLSHRVVSRKPRCTFERNESEAGKQCHGITLIILFTLRIPQKGTLRTPGIPVWHWEPLRWRGKSVGKSRTSPYDQAQQRPSTPLNCEMKRGTELTEKNSVPLNPSHTQHCYEEGPPCSRDWEKVA